MNCKKIKSKLKKNLNLFVICPMYVYGFMINKAKLLSKQKVMLYLCMFLGKYIYFLIKV